MNLSSTFSSSCSTSHSLLLPASTLFTHLSPSILSAGHQSPHLHLCFCRSSVTGYYFSCVLCLLLLYVCIHLSPLSMHLSLLLQQDFSWPSLFSGVTETEREKLSKMWGHTVQPWFEKWESKGKHQRPMKVSHSISISGYFLVILITY